MSKFSGKHPGCGGFIDISQSAKQVIFAGTFTSGGLKVSQGEGKDQKITGEEQKYALQSYSLVVYSVSSVIEHINYVMIAAGHFFSFPMNQ